MMRHLCLLFILVLTLTACSVAPAEEQMYAAAIDTFFTQTQGFERIQHRVVYIDPHFGGVPGQPVPAVILDRIVAHTNELGFIQITTPPPLGSGGLFITLYPVRSSKGEHFIKIGRFDEGGRLDVTYKVYSDTFGWKAEAVAAEGY